jgi:hypothetical protein
MAYAVGISMKEQIMNLVIASNKKSLFTKKAFGMAGAAALIIATLFLAGCNTGMGYDIDEATPDPAVRSVLDDPDIYGTWRYDYNYTSDNVQYTGYEQYVIATGTLAYTFYDELYGDYGSFTASIAEVVYNEDSDSGVIIIQYVNPPTEDEAPFNAVYFDNLTTTTVQLANAVNLSDYSSSAVGTLTEAQNNFTWANVDDYINWTYVNAATKVD